MRPVADERTAVAATVASLLAALTLTPLVAGQTWLIVAGVVLVTVMITGIIARHLLNHWAAVAAVQVVVFVLALEVLFARSRLLDGPGAVTALTDLLRAGLEVTRDQPPPVDASQGVILLAAGGAGLVALAVDVLACSLRQPALAGLPLLAVYCVPAALLEDGLPWYYFAAAATGFLLLLSADAGERVQAWGRVLSSGAQKRFGRSGDGSPLLGRLSMGGLSSGGRRVGAVAVVAAVLLPAVIPGLGNQILGGSGEGDGSGSGDGGAITRINPIINLRDDLTSSADKNVITYRTNVANPQPLRIVTADVFNGDRWSPNTTKIPLNNKVQNGLPAAPGLGSDISAELRTTQIRIDALQQTYLPLPYPATRVNITGDWLYDTSTLNVIGRGVNTQNTSYTAEHLDVEPTAEQLAAAPAASANLNPIYTLLPERMPSVIKATAQQVAKTGTAYQQAIRLQRWFRDPAGGFTYSFDAPTSRTGDSSTNAIAQFLTVKKGYCVHFAAAMAVMARSLGIPARVAIGFLPGDRQPDGSMVISTHDAHAWPELYFEGVGWVRFEPTPRAGEAVPPAWTVAPSGTLPEDPAVSASAQAAPSRTVTATPSAAATAQPQKNQAAGDDGLDIPWLPILVAVLVLGLLLAPWLTVQVASSRRWRSASSAGARAEAAWEELRLGLGDLGVRWASTWTPRAVQARLGHDYDLGGAGSAALARLVSAIESARYAPPGQLGLDATGAPPGITGPAWPAGSEGSEGSAGMTGPAESAGTGSVASAADLLRADVRAVLQPVTAATPRAGRLRARWAPPSAGAVLGSMLTGRQPLIPASGRPADTPGSEPVPGRDRTPV